jgi:hypothetical protein
MTSSKPQQMFAQQTCAEHTELMSMLATEQERSRSLERERDECTAAVLALTATVDALHSQMLVIKDDLTSSIHKIETRLAWGAGVLACLSSLPLIWQVVIALSHAGGTP